MTHTLSDDRRQRPRGLTPLLIAALGVFAVVPSLAPSRATAQEILRREEARDWTLIANVRLRAWQERIERIRHNRDQVPDIRSFEFDSATLVFPAISGTASSVADGPIEGTVQVENAVADNEPSIIPQTYHSGTRLARWDLRKTQAKTITLEVTMRSTCYSTVLDEEAALRIDWPTGAWPAIAQSTFQPQTYVDVDPNGASYDMQYVEKLARRWTKGKDPKSIPPLTLAKYFAGQLVEYYQPSGNGLAFSRAGLLEGIDLQGAAISARRARGSIFDMVTLYVALLREAGLPARIVIGWAEAEEEDEEPFDQSSGSGDNLHAWAEFFLYDEARKKGWWIPVDVVKIRDGQSRMPPGYLEKPLQYFGTHKDLDNIVPFSFHFHPPTSVIAYGTPGFWGWNVFPQPPSAAFQEIRFTQFRTPNTPERQRERREGRRP